MANQHGFGHLGEFGLDDALGFLVREEDFSFTANYIDIWDTQAGATVQEDLLLDEPTAAAGIVSELRGLDASLALTVANGFKEGGYYQIIIKAATGQTPVSADWEMGPSFCIGRQVTIEADTAHLYRGERSDGLVSSSPNSAMGRLYTLELNQTLNLSPKLRRILAYLGENQVVDGAFFDGASNVIKMRIRGYDTEDNARAAVRWIDTEKEADPVGAFPTTGELFRNIILAAHDTPRQLRTELLGSLSPEDGGSGDASDQQYDGSSAL